jgi:tRNA (guanine26-N2/guanine27-N2)-dimethyltransferase
MGDIVKTKEGGTDLYVYKQYFGQPKGPKEKVADTVFYNPEMALGRDVGIGFFSTQNTKDWYVLDGLAGTGVRGIRLANESGKDFDLLLNDANPKASKLIRRNVKANNRVNAAVRKNKLETLLSQHIFHYIDVDPFGTPAGFIHPALLSVRNKGYLSVTATDTAVLCGAYKKTCIRRYGATPIKGTPTHEMGLRILIGFITREAAKLDISAVPVLAHATQHYMRIYLKIEKGSTRADKALANLGKIDFDIKTQQYSEISSNAEGGPLWTAPILDKRILKKMLKPKFSPADEKRYHPLVQTLHDEADLPLGYYESNALAKALKMSSRPFSTITSRLEERGYRWSRTHVMPNAFKTDAPYKEVVKAFSKK